MMYTMPKNLLSICVNFALATQPFLRSSLIRALEKIQGNINFLSGRTFTENSESRERCFPKNRNEPEGVIEA